MPEPIKKRIGEILVEDGVLSKENLEEALVHQKKEGGVIGQILIRLGYVSEENLIAALSKQLSIPYLPIMNYSVDTEVSRKMDHDFCKMAMMIAFDEDDRYVYLATSDPLNTTAIQNAEKVFSKRPQIFISTPSEIQNLLDLAFAGKSQGPNQK